jgi:hypothetical protein
VLRPDESISRAARRAARLTAVLLAMSLLPLTARAAAPPGRLLNARLSDTPGGAAVTVFPTATQIVYLNFSYQQMAAHQIDVRLLDAASNVLFTASRVLSGAGSESIGLESVIAVDRLYDALDEDATDLILAIDWGLSDFTNASWRYEHAQTALVLTNRMRAAIAALRGLPLPAAAATALDNVADRLEGARSEGLGVLSATTAQQALPHMQAMRAQSIDLIVALRNARALSGGGTYPFPPSVDCQPYLVNVSVNGLLRESLEFAVGDPGKVADLHLVARQPVIYPGVPGMNATSVEATLVDASCEPVRDGTVVTFSVAPTALATVSPITATTTRGLTTTVVRAASAASGEVTVTATAGSSRAVTVIRLVGTPGSVNLSAGAATLPPGGETTVVAQVGDASGQPVPDGTLISFRVEPSDRGSISPATVMTRHGQATAIFHAGPATGNATVRAAAGDTSGQLLIIIADQSIPTSPPPFPTAVPTPGIPPPPPPTAIPSAPRPECPGRDANVLCNLSLAVRVYRDDTCNRRFDAAWDRPLAGVPVILVFPNGYVETVATSNGGQSTFGALTLRRGEHFRVYATLAPDQVLCYNSYTELNLGFDDFGPTGHAGVSFRTH